MTMFAYTIKRLTPQALAQGTNSWSYLRRGPSEDHQHTANDSSIKRLNSDIPRALQPGKWSKGKDGFLLTDIWLTESGSSIASTPVVWIRDQQMFLVIYQHRNLTIVLLIPSNSLVNGEKDLPFLKQQFIDNVGLLSLCLSSF